MKKQNGFTLIELVVVIVVLGILAVTAAPKFMNLQGDARQASLQGLKGAMQGAAGIVYGKAAVDGKETIDESTVTEKPDVEGIKITFGYPMATSEGIVKAVNGLDSDWFGVVSGATYLVTLKSLASTGDATTITDTGCYVTYKQATSSAAATTTVTITGGACQ